MAMDVGVPLIRHGVVCAHGCLPEDLGSSGPLFRGLVFGLQQCLDRYYMSFLLRLQ